MPNDIFGIEKVAHGANEIVLSSGVLVKIKDTVVLAQTANLDYQRTVQPVYELGSEDIWVQVSPAAGSANISRAVSASKNVYVYGIGQGCEPYDITLSKGKGCTAQLDTVTATGCTTTSIGLQVNAGQGFLTETIQAHVGMVRKS